MQSLNSHCTNQVFSVDSARAINMFARIHSHLQSCRSGHPRIPVHARLVLLCLKSRLPLYYLHSIVERKAEKEGKQAQWNNSMIILLSLSLLFALFASFVDGSFLFVVYYYVHYWSWCCVVIMLIALVVSWLQMRSKESKQQRESMINSCLGVWF